MEDDNGLELSLGLSFGGLSAKGKGKNASSSDIRSEEGDRGNNKVVDDFKNFFNASTQKQQGSSTGSQRGDSSKPKENFFSDLSKPSFDGGDASLDLNGKGVFGEETRAETGSKRRMFFDEISQPKKHEREAQFADTNEKTRASHISLTTDEGSTAENEDVAESEVEGSTSRLIHNHHHHHHHDDGAKRFIGISGSSSDAQKETKAVDPSGQKRFTNTPENGFKLGNISYGSPFPGHPIMNMPFPMSVKEGNSTAATSTSAHLLPGVMQVMPSANGEGPTNTQPMYPGNVPLMFGYPPVQIPMLDKDSSWGLVSQPQLPFHPHPPFAGRGPPNSALMHVISHNSTEAAQHDARASERAKAGEEGSSSHAEEDGKGSSANARARDGPDRPAADGSSLEFSAIKPGILADVQFGGSGLCPNLPWVSSTGQNGRTISGVTYRFNANQIRIVCACHGTHMSPDEFVSHANEEPGSNPENGNGLASFPNTNPAASAQS